jgi:hypothetical protein
MNNKLIYQLVNENSEEEINVLLPESKVANYIDENNLRKDPRDRIFQKYYEEIDADFPYPDLTLKEMGIPEFDILNVSSNLGKHYIELSGDSD